MNLPDNGALEFHEQLARAKRNHDEAKAAWQRGEVPDEVYTARLDELEQLQLQRAYPLQRARLRRDKA